MLLSHGILIHDSSADACLSDTHTIPCEGLIAWSAIYLDRTGVRVVWNFDLIIKWDERR